MENIINCCFCGKEIKFNESNSTWGCWTPSEERAGLGEKNRCCNHCNKSKVIPSRNQNYEQTGSYDDTSWWGVS